MLGCCHAEEGLCYTCTASQACGQPSQLLGTFGAWHIPSVASSFHVALSVYLHLHHPFVLLVCRKPWNGIIRGVLQEREVGGFKAEAEEEYEDKDGNVYNKRTYEDLKRQGLI